LATIVVKANQVGACVVVAADLVHETETGWNFHARLLKGKAKRRPRHV
jgi:hypothetical protein